MSLNAADKPKNDKQHILFFPDLTEPFPLYPDVLRQYFSAELPNALLKLYLTEENMNENTILALETELEKYKNETNLIEIKTGSNADAPVQIFNADYYITTRGGQTIKRTCLANLYKTQILYGTDKPIFAQLY